LQDRLQDLEHEKRNLGDIQKGLDKAGARGMLLGIDPAGDGKVVIAVGNPDTAQHTAVWVPGLSTDAGSTADNVERMMWLNDATQTHLKDGETTATVYWLGYDAPETTNLSVAFEERSRQGAGPYINFVDGLTATHPGDPHLTAIGHSYGTTVLGEAAKSGDLHVDEIVTAGSPGMHVAHARDLHIDPRHVWAGSAANDPVSATSTVTPWAVGAGTILGGPLGPVIGWGASEIYDRGHNVSPHQPAFGANQYVADTDGHTHYWNPGSQSLNNQAAIIAGDYGAVGLDHGRIPEHTP
jgi:hypothetical protein